MDLGDNGSPQGSILAGLFFGVYQNDFPANSAEENSVLFVDDDTDNVADSDPDNLELKLQVQANSSAEWVRDNCMVCSGEKTKLLTITTRDIRNRNLLPNNRKLQVEVCGKVVNESVDEKLLGVIVSNDLRWKTHLYGNNKTGKEKLKGLIPKLAQRVGILSKLSRVMPQPKFSNVIEGIFTSTLRYCLQLFGNVWGYDNLDENNRRFEAFTKEDNRRIQCLQNKVLRLKTGMNKHTPIVDLLKASGDMSVQQMTAYSTLMTVHKVVTTGSPGYLAQRLALRKPDGGIFPNRQLNTIAVPNVRLTLSRGGFVYRGATLWNLLPANMRGEEKTQKFKLELRKWIRSNILHKPP